MQAKHPTLSNAVTVSAMLAFTLLISSASSADASSDATPAEAYKNSFIAEKALDYEEAIRHLIPLKDMPLYKYAAQFRLGWLYYCTANYANSRNAYQNALKVQPASLEARVAYLLPVLAQGSYEEAETIAKQITDTDRFNYFANVRLAYALRMQRKFSPAEKVDLQMLQYYPSDVTIMTELGLAKLGQQQQEPARKIFTEILAVDPDNVTAKAVLAKK
jgi:tetratricopeptide (TPR) repeat protein